MANLFDVPQFIEDAPSLAVNSGSDETATQAAVIFDDVGKVFANCARRVDRGARQRHVECGARRSVRHHRPQRCGQVDAVAARQRPGETEFRRGAREGRERRRTRRARARGVAPAHRHGVSALQSAFGEDGAREHCVAAENRRCAEGGDRQKSRCAAGTGGLVGQTRRVSGESCPVVRSSASALRARWSPTPTFCFATKPPPHWIRKRRKPFSRCCAISISA